MKNHRRIMHMAITVLLAVSVTTLAPSAQAGPIQVSVGVSGPSCQERVAFACHEAATLADVGTMNVPLPPPFAVSPMDRAPEVGAGGDPIPTRIACVTGGGKYDFICCEGISGICAGFHDCRVTIGTETSVSCAVDIL